MALSIDYIGLRFAPLGWKQTADFNGFGRAGTCVTAELDSCSHSVVITSTFDRTDHVVLTGDEPPAFEERPFRLVRSRARGAEPGSQLDQRIRPMQPDPLRSA